LRAQLALIGQHAALFDDTVAHNIGYGRQGATLDEIREAARRAIATLDRGSGVDQSELMLKTEQLTAAKTK
ncbi:MAG: hypothetical protein K1X38_11255, partial [Microthrixaceae bacterium]|nr:hypothetical protein [Microthrixaceae bacterium]